jgi:hypothetical protein
MKQKNCLNTFAEVIGALVLAENIVRLNANERKIVKLSPFAFF